AQRLVGEVIAALSRERADIEYPQQVQPENDHENAAHALDPSAMLEQQPPEHSRGCAERQENECKPGDEEERENEREATRTPHVAQAQSRDEHHVAWDERQHAGREKAQ